MPMNNPYIQFSVCDARGQYQKPFAIEVMRMNWHGMTDEGMLIDIVHADKTQERILIRTEKYGDFRIGECKERIMDIAFVQYPSSGDNLTKDEFHARVGKGKFLHPTRGHYVDESELPDVEQASNPKI